MSTAQQKNPPKQAKFNHFAREFSRLAGHSNAFAAASLLILVWLLTGPVFHFSNTWQLVINTGTTIITFLMVFIIQNTQNRDSAALQLKVDELIRALKGAHNRMLILEDMEEEDLDELKKKYTALAKGPNVQPEDMEECGEVEESVIKKETRHAV